MLRIPRRYGHFIFAVIQSGMTSGIAAAIASTPFLYNSTFMAHWLASWLVAWAAMAPIVLLLRHSFGVLALTIAAELD